MDYILVDITNANWNGTLPYRGRHSLKGYPSIEAADARRRQVVSHYNSKYGTSPGDLRVVPRTKRGSKRPATA